MSKHQLIEAIAEGVDVHSWYTDSNDILSSLLFLKLLSGHLMERLLLLQKSCKPEIGYCYQKTHLHRLEKSPGKGEVAELSC